MPNYDELRLQSQQKIAEARAALEEHDREEAKRLQRFTLQEETRLEQEETRRRSFDLSTITRKADEEAKRERAHRKRERLQTRLNAALLAGGWPAGGGEGPRT